MTGVGGGGGGGGRIGGGGSVAENMPNRESVPTSGALSMGGGAADVKQQQTSYAGIMDNRRSDTTLGRGIDVALHAQVPQHVKPSVSPGQPSKESQSVLCAMWEIRNYFFFFLQSVPSVSVISPILFQYLVDIHFVEVV